MSEQLAKPIPERCDDAKIMRIWRECGLPEYFLGNGGTNTKLVEFAARVSESRVKLEDEFLKLQAHSKAIREALEAAVDNIDPGWDYSEWLDRARAALRTEVPKP